MYQLTSFEFCGSKILANFDEERYYSNPISFDITDKLFKKFGYVIYNKLFLERLFRYYTISNNYVIPKISGKYLESHLYNFLNLDFKPINIAICNIARINYQKEVVYVQTDNLYYPLRIMPMNSIDTIEPEVGDTIQGRYNVLYGEEGVVIAKKIKEKK